MHLSSRIAQIESQLIATDRERRDPAEQSIRLGKGLRLPRAAWDELSPEHRHLARMLAVHRRSDRPPVFSHASAAVLLGMPLLVAHSPVHITTGAGGARRNSEGLTRHSRDLGADEVVEVEGLRCTSPDRTILDLARFDTAEIAVACADAHLRSEFRVRRSVDTTRLEEWRADMLESLAEKRGERGVRRARRVLEIADARTDSPLESVSHLQLRRLGLEVDLQVLVRSPNHGSYHVDFELLGLDVLGECDGRAKYLDSSLRGDRSAEEVLYSEKRRHDWVEGVTGKRLIRWGWIDVRSANALSTRLREFRVPLPFASRYGVASS